MMRHLKSHVHDQQLSTIQDDWSQHSGFKFNKTENMKYILNLCPSQEDMYFT